MSPSNLGLHNATMREIVADGAEVGTFKYPDRSTIHAYVELAGWDPVGTRESFGYIACGLHGLIVWRRRYPETMDCHGGVSAVTCGRCTRILGDVLGAQT